MFWIVAPVVYPNNPTLFVSGLLIVIFLITCPLPSKVPVNAVEVVPIGSQLSIDDRSISAIRIYFPDKLFLTLFKSSAV